MTGHAAWLAAYDEESRKPLMGIRTTNRGSDIELAPEGMHLARCCRVIDCGTQVNARFGKRQRKGWIFFELPMLMQRAREGRDAQPFMVGKQYTLSHNEKSNLRADLESWYGTRFDTQKLDAAGGFALERLVGRAALLNLVHSEDGVYANIMSINPLPAGMECPPAVWDPVVFTFEPFTEPVLETLSQGMQEFIKKSEEYRIIKGIADPATGLVPGTQAPGGGNVPAGAAPAKREDLPYGDAPAPRQVVPPKAAAGGKHFEDMADDIPF